MHLLYARSSKLVLYRRFAKLDDLQTNHDETQVPRDRLRRFAHVGIVRRRVQHELMLLTELAVVRAAHVVLASASPRRVQILNEQLGINAVVMPSFFEENLEKSQYTPHEYVRENALQKALEVYNRLSEDDRPPSCVIGADTVVVLGDEVLEKPRDKADAAAMLARLSAAGRHEVCTGVALVYCDNQERVDDDATSDGLPVVVNSFMETTKVNFAPLSPELIEAYVETGEPMDKAGAYGIQGLGGSFVTGIEGDYLNVVGFPMHRFCAELDVAHLAEWSRTQLEIGAWGSRADPSEPAEVTDAVVAAVSATCTDDECGLPSD